MPSSKPNIEKPVHGSISPAELRMLGLKIEDVIDFSANINPLGVSPNVKEAIANVDFSRYPDPDCLDLREALAEVTGVNMANIMIGNGSTELIHLLARSCLGGNSAAVILAPTFGEYELACRLSGVEPVFIHARAEDDFHWNMNEVRRQIKQIKPQLVFFCNPNNPTGLYSQKETIELLAEATAPGILAVDEAYLPFVDKRWNSTSLLEMENVVLLRSMTKDHALTGLRLGYALAPTRIIESLRIFQPCWNVNTVAQAAGITALANQQHVTQARQLIDEARSYLHTYLTYSGLRVLPSSVNFFLVESGDAKKTRSQLLEHGLCVRDCSSFGLPEYIRITCGVMSDCEKLVEGFRKIYNKHV